MTRRLLAVLVPVLFLCIAAGQAARAEETPAGITNAICVIHPTEGNKCSGVLKFTQDGGKLKIAGDLEGLTPGAKHAMHIHEFGDCSSKDGMSAGGHYNPEHHEHGLPEKALRHAGDLGNLQADKDGKAHYEITLENASLAEKNAVLGRSVIIHAKADDGGQPVGNAGGRIGCGVIGIAKALK